MDTHSHAPAIVAETPEEPTEYAYGGDLSRPETWTASDYAALEEAQVERWEGTYLDPRSYDEISDEDARSYADEVEERRHEHWTDASPR